MRNLVLTVLFLAGTAHAGPSWDELSTPTGWEHVADKRSDAGDVSVKHKTIGGLDCLEGIASTAVPPDKLLEVAMDVPSATEWSSADLTASELLAKADDHVHLYQYLDVPNWTLVADRYWVLEGRPSSFGDGGKRFRWNRLPAEANYPELYQRVMAANDKAVEPPINWGEWVFTPKDGATEVRYRACADIGGSIPLWVQKLVAKSTLPDTVADLIREAATR